MGRGGTSDLALTAAAGSYDWLSGHIARLDFNGAVDVDYWTMSHCETDEDGNSSCGMICRCRTVEEPTATVLDKAQVAMRLFDQWWMRQSLPNGQKKQLPEWTPFDAYCADRLFEQTALLDQIRYDDWQVEITRGYYGEEIGSVTLDELASRQIADALQPLLELPIGERLLTLLTPEREGADLSAIPTYDWRVEMVSLKKIPFVSVDKPRGDYCFRANYGEKMPLAVVIKVDSGYLLVDGRERLSGALDYAERYHKPQSGKSKTGPFRVPVIVGHAK